jgi:Two component regulator propeller
MRTIGTFIFVLLLCLAGVAQTSNPEFPPLKIGEWRAHLPWQYARSVTQSSNKVYFATEWAVVEVDKAERSPRFLTKVEGLSDVGIERVRFNPATNILVIAYANSNLDLWKPADGSAINLPFIAKNVNLAGGKKINDIAMDGQFAYLAGDFGLLKLNLARAEVVFTTFTPTRARSVAVYEGNMYVGTTNGLYALPVDDPNPADFSRWRLVNAGFPAGRPVSALAVSGGGLFLGVEKAVYRFDGREAKLVEQDRANSIVYLSADGPGVLMGFREGFDGRVVYRAADGALSTVHEPCDARIPFYGIEDGARKFWFADLTDDFRYFDATTGRCDRLRFNSPYNHQSSEIVVSNDHVFVATPGFDVNLNAIYSRLGLYIFDKKESQWRRFNGTSNPELEGGDCDKDFWRVIPHPTEDKFHVGSFVGGMVQVEEGGKKTDCFNQNNSILQNAGASGSNRTAIAGMAYDESGNLWICNYGAASPIAVLKKDGTLRNFTNSLANNLLQVVVDRNGFKWFVVGFNGGVLVYDSGKDLDNPADDRYQLFTTSNSKLPSNTVTSIAVDLDGDVWVGTQKGVVVYQCGGDAVFTQCANSRPQTLVDGFRAELLETEEVRTIAIDGGNRKWFGTFNGIFVQSPDGRTEEARFTTANSPLFDNAITDIAIDQRTGEVWIGTERGLQSLRAEATQGGRVNTSQPYAYPNPVRPDYDGPIAIYGLARDANVKITDVTGNLVYEGRATGGQAVWDGRDYLGRRAASGVYLIFATSTALFENPDAAIAKIVVLN